MLETIAICSGVASLIVSLFAIISIYLTKKNIVDILDKDAILFDNNFEIKKNALSAALSIIDEINTKGVIVRNDNHFVAKAKQCYNDLLCVVTHLVVADEFIDIALNIDPINLEERIKIFKLACRYDIGLDTKRKQTSKPQSKPENETPSQINSSVFSQPTATQANHTQPVNPQPQATVFEAQSQMPEPVMPTLTQQPALEVSRDVQTPRPQTQTVRQQMQIPRAPIQTTNQAQPVRQPMQPARPQGVNPAQQTRMVAPNQMQQPRQPMQQPTRQVGRPRKNG